MKCGYGKLISSYKTPSKNSEEHLGHSFERRIEEGVHDCDEKEDDEDDTARSTMNVLGIAAAWMTLRELLGKSRRREPWEFFLRGKNSILSSMSERRNI